ncbi:MAG: hypothetical protein JEZ11_12770 [Desulfobacterales bacterium]|nr:hypothetical protein [Desulfobacterales bacterium]
MNNIRIKAMDVSKNLEYLGEQIESPSSSELAELTAAFNLMSLNLRQERDQLESRVIERTEELNGLNIQLETEANEHRKTIGKLEKSLTEIKTLRGILPICSHCKKIRDDKGYWNQIESYIQEHSEVDFSHSICQECAKKYYPDINFCDDDREIKED